MTSTPDYKFAEDKILEDLKKYIDSTYKEHYHSSNSGGDDSVTCVDAWVALGSASSTIRDNMLKYLWRYGKKGGKNRKDLEKVLHYGILLLWHDHYRTTRESSLTPSQFELLLEKVGDEVFTKG